MTHDLDAGNARSFHLVWIGCLLANVQTGAAAIRGGGMHVSTAISHGCAPSARPPLEAWSSTVSTAHRRCGALH